MGGFMLRKKKCRYCGEWFKPLHRLKSRQIACFNPDCQASHKRILDKKEKAKELRRLNSKDWQKEHKLWISKYNKLYYGEHRGEILNRKKERYRRNVQE